MHHHGDRVEPEGRHENRPHAGMDMRPWATGPQLTAVGILSVLALAVGVLLALLGTEPEIRTRAIDVALVAWFGLTVPSVAYVAGMRSRVPRSRSS